MPKSLSDLENTPLVCRDCKIVACDGSVSEECQYEEEQLFPGEVLKHISFLDGDEIDRWLRFIAVEEQYYCERCYAALLKGEAYYTRAGGRSSNPPHPCESFDQVEVLCPTCFGVLQDEIRGNLVTSKTLQQAVNQISRAERQLAFVSSCPRPDGMTNRHYDALVRLKRAELSLAEANLEYIRTSLAEMDDHSGCGNRNI